VKLVQALAMELAQVRGTLAQVALAVGVPAASIPGKPAPTKEACRKAGMTEQRGWNTMGKLAILAATEQRAALDAVKVAKVAKLAALGDKFTFDLSDLPADDAGLAALDAPAPAPVVAPDAAPVAAPAPKAKKPAKKHKPECDDDTGKNC
jgi:hypothetical protein